MVHQDTILPRRASGVLLHPTSLDGPGIGDLGSSALHFLDWLVEAGQSYWQILPLVPVDAGGSPYNGLSALAGNPLLLAPEVLEAEGLLTPAARASAFPEGHVDFDAVSRWKEEMLRNAYGAFRDGAGGPLAPAFRKFQKRNAAWLPDYSLFRALRHHFGELSWTAWPEGIRLRRESVVQSWRAHLAEEIEQYAFQQFLFDRQWGRVRSHAHARGIRIIGDVPIFVAHDSADVWANPELFQLDPDGAPSVVAGVPPDYFSPTGQRWGNPLYRWDEMRRRGYAWWIERFRRTLEQVDLIRVDHFRGFEAYWEIPADQETAIEGRWVPGPGERIFRVIEEQLGPLPLVAEDLGLITREVHELREALGLPGMRVLQFAFDGDPQNPHLPENHPVRTVAYTGTHDNDTVVGWWSVLGDAERERVRRYLQQHDPTAWDFIAALFASPAELAIIPAQDLLGLGSGARMNTPGKVGQNWSWRLGSERLDSQTAQELRALAAAAGRGPEHLSTRNEDRER